MSVTKSQFVDRIQLCSLLTRLPGLALVIAVMMIDTRVADGQEPFQPLRSWLRSPVIRSNTVPSTNGPEISDTDSQSGGGKMGVRIRNAEGSDGVFVTSIEPVSPAQRAGLKLGDRIVAVDRRMVADTWGLIRDVSSHSPGESITLQLVRNAQLYAIRITLTGEGPASAVVPPVRSAATKVAVASATSNAEEAGSAVGGLLQLSAAMETLTPPQSQEEAAESESATSKSADRGSAAAAAGEPDDALALDDNEPTDHFMFESRAEIEAKSDQGLASPPPNQSAGSTSDRITRLKAEIKRLEEELQKLEPTNENRE